MLLWLQKKAAEGHQGAVLVTGLDCGSQHGYRGSLRDIRALRMASV